MSVIDPAVRKIMDELNMRKSGNMTVTVESHYEGPTYQGPTYQGTTYHTELVKRSGLPPPFTPTVTQNIETTGAISYEEWMARHPESRLEVSPGGPSLIEEKREGGFVGGMMSHEEWLTRHPEQNQQIISMSHEEWMARQGKPEPITMSHEEWLARQGRGSTLPLSNSRVVGSNQYSGGTVRETITQEEWLARQQPGYIRPISQSEWLTRQSGVKVSGEYNKPVIREEVVKKSGVVSHGNMAPYDYRDFRPLEFNLEYRDYKPSQYERMVQGQNGENVLTRVVDEPKFVVQQQPLHEERKEDTKKGGTKGPIMESDERGSSRWCC